MSPKTLIKTLDIIQPVRLNPFQQWQYFTDPRATYHRFSQEYEELAAMHFQGQDLFMPVTPDAVRTIFTADPNGYDAFWKDSFAALNGEGSLWVLEGEKHRRERQLFAPAVHAHYFRGYGDTIQRSVQEITGKWGAGGDIRAIDTSLEIALEVITRLVFGVVDEELLQKGRKVIGALTSSAHPLIVFFPKLQRPWFPLWRRYVSAKKDLYDWFDRVIAFRRANDEPGHDVLAVLMDACDEDGRPYSDEHIKNELLSVLTAGHVTTAVALSWALYELGLHPEVMQELRQELEGLGERPETEDLISLPYLSAVINETIRLHPILSECARVVNHQMELFGRTFYPGQAFVISINGMHHNPSIYPEPYAYKPERFLERKYSNFEFLPFGGGHRRCLGAGLAEYTLRIALAEIAQNWDLKTLRKDYDIRNDLAMGPKYGVSLRVRRRAL